MKLILASLIFFKSNLSWSELPIRPTEPNHPSSAIYTYGFKREKIVFQGREMFLYLPISEVKDSNLKFPLLVFGHGQAIGHEGYELTFEHLARKGTAVLFSKYDKNFFDRNWQRMASDFNRQTGHVLKIFSHLLDPESVIYTGHSKGAYVGLVALGEQTLKQMNFKVRAAVFFSPAGFDEKNIEQINSTIPISIIWPEKDQIIKSTLVYEIFNRLPNIHKQFILVKSYDDLEIDHFFPLSKSYIFGGQNGLYAYHYYGVWKWLLGAVDDVTQGGQLNNRYLYGDLASSTGVDNLKHEITRSWSR